jgi:hypothetical protein
MRGYAIQGRDRLDKEGIARWQTQEPVLVGGSLGDGNIEFAQ